MPSMRRSILAPCALAVLLLPSVARADDDDDEEQMVIVEGPVASPPPDAPPVMIVRPVEPPANHPPKTVEVSYASETLLLDGAAVAMFAFGVASDTQPLPSLGLLTYALAPPIAHFTHGHVGKGFADMGVRLVAPFVFAMPGVMIASAVAADGPEERRTAMDVGGFTGLALGAAFAMAVDALFFAKERIAEERAYMIGCAGCSGRSGRGSSSSSSPSFR